MGVKKGNTNINKLYKGSAEIGKVYRGTTLIYQKNVPVTTLNVYVAGTTARTGELFIIDGFSQPQNITVELEVMSINVADLPDVSVQTSSATNGWQVMSAVGRKRTMTLTPSDIVGGVAYQVDMAIIEDFTNENNSVSVKMTITSATIDNIPVTDNITAWVYGEIF